MMCVGWIVCLSWLTSVKQKTVLMVKWHYTEGIWWFESQYSEDFLRFYLKTHFWTKSLPWIIHSFCAPAAMSTISPLITHMHSTRSHTHTYTQGNLSQDAAWFSNSIDSGQSVYAAFRAETVKGLHQLLCLSVPHHHPHPRCPHFCFKKRKSYLSLNRRAGNLNNTPPSV